MRWTCSWFYQDDKVISQEPERYSQAHQLSTELGLLCECNFFLPSSHLWLLEPQNLYKNAIDQHGLIGDPMVRCALQLDLCLN